ncbi:uncharacterized protein HaLaN_12166, partial [Haematococcus lacustris]
EILGPAGHQRAPAKIWGEGAGWWAPASLVQAAAHLCAPHANMGRLLRHAVHTTREMEAAMAAWQLDMVPWQQSEPTNLEAGPQGPENSQVASRWDALLPNPRRQKLASPKHRFDQVVHTDGVAISVMFLQPKPAAPPAELTRMDKSMGAVNPLAHLHAEWLGVDPGKMNMATVAHEERSADGSVVPVRHWTLTAGQYYRDSGITRQAQATKIWLAHVKTQLTALSHVSSKPRSLASYRRFADTVLATYDAMWAEVSKPRWANARFRRGGFVLGQGQHAGKEAVAGPHPGPGLWGSWLQGHRHHWLQGCPCQPDAEGGIEAVQARACGAGG